MTLPRYEQGRQNSTGSKRVANQIKFCGPKLSRLEAYRNINPRQFGTSFPWPVLSPVFLAVSSTLGACLQAFKRNWSGIRAKGCLPRQLESLCPGRVANGQAGCLANICTSRARALEEFSRGESERKGQKRGRRLRFGLFRHAPVFCLRSKTRHEWNFTLRVPTCRGLG